MTWQPQRRIALAAALLILAAFVPALGQETVQVPAGLTAERDLEVQPSVPLLPTPWLARHESGGIVYFLYTTAARVERFDLASGSWLADIALPETPTAFWADADGLYVSFGRRTSRFALDGTGEAHLRNTGVDATGLFTVGDFLYIYAPDDLLSANKWTGALIDQEEYWYTMQGLSVAPTVGKAFARSVGVSPSDIVEVVLAPDGTLGQQDDSPYHGDYPSATRTWVFPDGTRVADDAGIVYSTADLTYAGSLAGPFDDLAFAGDLPIVLRDGALYAYSIAGLRTGQYAPAQPSLGLAVHGSSVFSFYQGAVGIEAEEIPLALFSQPLPGPPVDPDGLEYVPDAQALGADEIVYLLSAENLSVFRWSLARKQYLETIPLVETPTFMAYSAENDALYLAHDSGEITVVALGGPADPLEVPFVNSPQTPCGLATAGEYLFVCDPSGAWVSHFTYSPLGALVSQQEWRHYSEEYVWSAVNRKMYYFRDDTSPNDLLWEDVDAGGVLGDDMDSPAHSSDGIVHPIRVAPDGSLVVLGSGRLYDAISLEHVDNLSNDIDDAVWAGGVLFSLRLSGGASQIQKWNQPNWGVGATRLVDGAPLRLFLAGGKLLAVTLLDGKPKFTTSNLELSMIFTDGFESGDVSAWSRAGGVLGGLLDAHGGAAATGLFGGEAKVGAGCEGDQDLVIAGSAVEGLFFACNSITAAGVEVGAAGADFVAGAAIGLGNGFSVPAATTFTAVLDEASADGLGYVEDDSPDGVGCYNARFGLDLDGLTLAAGDRVDHLVAYSSFGEVRFRAILLWNAALGENRLALEVRQDDGTFLSTLGTTEQVLPAGWLSLDLSWRAGGGDGHFLASVNGAPYVGLVSVDNALQRIDRIRWGNVGGTVTSSSGSLHLDDFESWE
jgi:hypothetical protein